MSQLYKNYRRRKFENWKQRVRILLPEAAIKYYRTKQLGAYIPYEKEVLLGNVIAAINNPFYGVCNRFQEPSDEISELSAEIVLKIQVNDLFSFLNKLSNPPTADKR